VLDDAKAPGLKILVVSQHFWPETFRINDVVGELSRRGLSVDVLAGQPNYPHGTIYAGYSAHKSVQERHPEGYTVFRVPIVPRGNASSFRLAANYLSFVFSAATLGLWLLRGRSYDIVFVYAVSPILQVIPALMIKLIKQARLNVWVQDLWPQALQATGHVRSKVLLKAARVVTGWLYRRANLLLVQSRSFVDDVRTLAGPKARIEVLPNPADASADVMRPGAEQRAPDGTFTVLFAGNIGTAQAIDTILGAAERLSQDPAIRIVIAGSGSRLAWLQQEIKARGLANVETPGQRSAVEIVSLAEKASVLLLTLGRSDALAKTVPSKLASYLACGRPIVVSADGETARIVCEADAGVAVPAEDPAALAAALAKLKACSPSELARLGRNGRRYYDANFSLERVVDQLIACFHEKPVMRSSGETKTV
jgi:glycosyltransferase involved in cell wall biosynthesis